MLKKHLLMLMALVTLVIAGCQGGGSSSDTDSSSGSDAGTTTETIETAESETADEADSTEEADTSEDEDTDTADDSESSESLHIVTTFYPMYAYTNEIVGDLAEVSLMVNSADVHGYEPSAQDVAGLQDSDIFVYANAEMETFVPALLESIDTSNLTVIEADANIDLLENPDHEGHDHDHDHGEEEADDHDHDHDHGEEEADGHDHDHDHGEEEADDHDHDHGEEEADGHDHDHHDHSHAVDPHTWVDPYNAITQVETIADALIEADPENEATYRENADAFIAELEQLAADYDATLTDTENDIFITQHAAFGYLAHRYDLEQESLAGLSSETEASAQRMAEIVDLINEHNIPVVYYNSTENSELAETVAQEAGIETALLYSLEYIEDESLADGAGFIQLMNENLDALSLSIN